MLKASVCLATTWPAVDTAESQLEVAPGYCSDPKVGQQGYGSLERDEQFLARLQNFSGFSVASEYNRRAQRCVVSHYGSDPCWQDMEVGQYSVT